MDTDSFYLAIAEENLYDYIQPEKRYIWEKLREIDCGDSFKADAKSNFFPQTCCSIKKKSMISMKKRMEPGL